ncbi:TPA: TIR domain-containing protein [Streptococcus suis]|nr:TIR domain-containing protein [Enterococcus faecalis]
MNLFFQKKEGYDLFLSHSYLDKKLIVTLVSLFNESGYSVYVDWLEDEHLDRSNVSTETAKFIKNRINQSKGLTIIATESTTFSKWCPWELGIADGMLNGRACILPILKDDGDFSGQEYLGMYPYLDYETSITGEKEFWLNSSIDKNEYVSLNSWLNGKSPSYHSN